MKIKKIASFVSAAIMAAMPYSVMTGTYETASLTAFADELSGDCYYAVVDDHVEITGCSANASDVKIPESIEGLPVTVIGDYAFDAASITSVTIPDSVRKIGNWSFTLCENLKSITIPDSIESIGISAFEMCSSLSEVNFPDHMVEIDAHAFEYTPWLTAQRQKGDFVVVNGDLIDAHNTKGDVVIPSDIKYVSPGAFDNNEDITSVVFPSNIKKLNDSTFFYCTNLKSADLRYVTEIEGMAFAGCENLKEIKLPANMTSINYYAFADINGSASITVYGSKSDWDKVEKNDEDTFLNNSTYIFEAAISEPDTYIEGDVNADGKFNTSDLVTMNQWLLGSPEAELKNWEAGDMLKDDVLDVFDLIMMRKALVS